MQTAAQRRMHIQTLNQNSSQRTGKKEGGVVLHKSNPQRPCCKIPTSNTHTHTHRGSLLVCNLAATIPSTFFGPLHVRRRREMIMYARLHIHLHFSMIPLETHTVNTPHRLPPHPLPPGTNPHSPQQKTKPKKKKNPSKSLSLSLSLSSCRKSDYKLILAILSASNDHRALKVACVVMPLFNFNSPVFICAALLLQFLHFACSQSFIGVNYGQVADNLPPPAATAKLLQSTSIEKVRLYGADPAIIRALAGTGIGIVIGAANGDIPALASDPNFAGQWVATNVLPYYPASKIIVITVGNEVMTSPDQNLSSQLLPAMQNVQNALTASSLGGKIKVSTVHSMAVLTQSDPPSSGTFNPGFGDTMKALLQFHQANGFPFMINPYPYFAYQSDPRAETLAFCLFQPNAGRVDSGTGIKYMNMFDAQVDAVHSALNALGFKDVEIVVAETGWPYKGDPNEVGPSLDNAKAYNGNLISHLRSLVGTPLMPGKSVDTYIFAIFDEDLKPGPSSERSFGLFKPDLSATYEVDLSKNSQTTPTAPVTPATPVAPVPVTPITPVTPVPKPAAGWCVPKPGVSDAQLQSNLDYACGQGIDCSPIQTGGTCFEPNTVAAHAAYAMNLLYQTAGRNPWNCDFMQTAALTYTNPSYGHCSYPGGNT